MSDWKTDGVRVIPKDSLDPNTAQTPGMDRLSAISAHRVGSNKLWMGETHVAPAQRSSGARALR